MILPSNDINPISEIITFLSDDDIPCDLANAIKCVYTTAAPKKNTQPLMSSKTKCTSENKVTVCKYSAHVLTLFQQKLHEKSFGFV